MTERLDRAIRAACEEAFGWIASDSANLTHTRTFARALIADILKPDPPTTAVEAIVVGWAFGWGSEAALYQIRKRAGLLTPEELAQEAEWEPNQYEH